MIDNKQKVTIYTDGACIGNPGYGGYGAVLLHKNHRKELSGGLGPTTNNRMEIIAAIVGLEALKRACEVDLYSDSLYLVDSMVKRWAYRWRENDGFRDKKKTKKAKNYDLWIRLMDLCDKHKVNFIWVKGHNGNPINERCDVLAEEAARKSDLPADEGYVAVSDD